MVRFRLLFTVAIVAWMTIGGLLIPPAFAGSTPSIGGFKVTNGSVSGLYTVNGTVSNAGSGAIVKIEGVLGTDSFPVNPDGTFSGSIYVGGSVSGTVGATAVTASGQQSNQAVGYIGF